MLFITLTFESCADNKWEQLSRYLSASSLCTAVVKFLAFTRMGRSDAERLLRPKNLNEEQSAADSLPSGLNNVFVRGVTTISSRSLLFTGAVNDTGEINRQRQIKAPVRR